MASFELYYPKLKAFEGGYASAADAARINDKGGETYKGIARNPNPNWSGWVIIDAYKAKYGTPKHYSYIADKNLDKLVDEYYKAVFWDAMKLDQVKNQSVAEAIADFGVNSGRGTAVKVVQRALGINADGSVGSQTISAINSANQQRLFNDIQTARKTLIQNIDHFSQDTKNSLIGRVNKIIYTTQVMPIVKATEFVKKNWKPILIVTSAIGLITAAVMIYNRKTK